MENSDDNNTQLPVGKSSLTPHELIKRHSEHPEQPITDEDMNNMNLHVENVVTDSGISEDEIQLSKKEKQKADDMADDLNKDNTGMSYKADL